MAKFSPSVLPTGAYRIISKNHDYFIVDKEGNIDVQAVSKGLEMGYKIKGAYSDEAIKPPIILMPVLVKFLNKDEGNNNGDTK